MNSPYMGNFKVTQEYKGSAHDGLDLVGLDSKEIHATVNGIVKAAGNTDPKGFGINVKILKDGTNDYYIYAHMSEVKVKVGQRVKITDLIGIEGSTGNSTGSHCHYCVRTGNVKGRHKDISAISGIPNKLGVYNDGYVPSKQDKPASAPSVQYQVYANAKWLPAVTNDSDFAGIKGCRISGLKASVSSGKIEYQAHPVGGSWLPWVREMSDYAGILGKPIDCIRARLIDLPGFLLQTRVAAIGKDYYPWVTNDSDYAGAYGKAVDRLQMRIVRR